MFKFLSGDPAAPFFTNKIKTFLQSIFVEEFALKFKINNHPLRAGPSRS